MRCSTMRTTPTWSTRTRGTNCGRSRVSRGAGTEESVGLWMTRWEGTLWAVAVCGTCIGQWQVPHRSWRQCCRFALTQVDALDMLAIVGDYKEFAAAVNRVQQHVKFDRNVTVSVYVGVCVCVCVLSVAAVASPSSCCGRVVRFETTIRVLGSLLSAHLIAADRDLNIMPEYRGGLLAMAVDLGHRIMPAFNTPSGLPAHRVNLKFGVETGEQRETCTAAAGTLVLEMALLSRLSGDHQFERAARRAVLKLWEGRSKLDLVGSSVDTHSGQWRTAHTGIGAGVDSFYECVAAPVASACSSM